MEWGKVIAASAAPAWSQTSDDSLEEIEKRHICEVLQRTNWNISQAAHILRVDRVTVYNKMRKFGLSREGAPVGRP